MTIVSHNISSVGDQHFTYPLVWPGFGKKKFRSLSIYPEELIKTIFQICALDAFSLNPNQFPDLFSYSPVNQLNQEMLVGLYRNYCLVKMQKQNSNEYLLHRILTLSKYLQGAVSSVGPRDWSSKLPIVWWLERDIDGVPKKILFHGFPNKTSVMLGLSYAVLEDETLMSLRAADDAILKKLAGALEFLIGLYSSRSSP